MCFVEASQQTSKSLQLDRIPTASNDVPDLPGPSKKQRHNKRRVAPAPTDFRTAPRPSTVPELSQRPVTSQVETTKNSSFHHILKAAIAQHSP